jgi:DNA photolyase-like FAD binding protein
MIRTTKTEFDAIKANSGWIELDDKQEQKQVEGVVRLYKVRGQSFGICRIINPWIQQKKFDPECVYIKRWVLELRNIPANSIHNLNKQRPMDLVAEYPFPIVNHSQVMEMAENHYR